MIDGTLYHLGMAVADMDAALERYGNQFGVERWATLDVTYDAWCRGVESVVTQRIAFAPWPMGGYLELVEGGTGTTCASDFLKERGEGMFHVGYSTTDLAQRPAPVCFEVRNGTGIVYLDTFAELGYWVELVPADRADALTTWIDQVAAGTPGIPAHR